MNGNRAPRRGLHALSFILALLMIGALLVACSEPDDGDGRANDGDQPTRTATAPGSITPTVDGTPTESTRQIDHPRGADELVLRIEYVGGFVPQESLLTHLPIFSLYGDGCFITEGPLPAIYPPPALPNLQETCATGEGVQEILRLAGEAGLLDKDQVYRLDRIADAPTTVFTVHADGRTIVTEAYALGIDAPTDQLPPGEIKAREQLYEFLQLASGLAYQLPEQFIARPEHPFEFTRLRLVTLPMGESSTPITDQGIEPATVEWPLKTPLSKFGEPYEFLQGARCGVVADADLEALKPDLQRSKTLTRWSSGGEEFILFARPLLPDEAGCKTPGTR